MRRFWRIVFLAALPTLLTCDAVAAPNAPSQPSPSNGKTNVQANPSLCVKVTDAQGGSLDVSFFGRDLSQTPGADFEVEVLPDTQNYAQMIPFLFDAQTQWIAENRKEQNIAFVSHVGDIVEIGYMEQEWGHASHSMGLLEDPGVSELEEGIPYGLSVGNHDQSPNDNPGTLEDPTSTTALFNQTFPVSRFEGKSWYGGHWGTNNDNSYQLFEAGGMKFIIFHLEFDYIPTQPALLDAVLDWVEETLDAYPDRRAMLTTHSLLCDGVPCPPTTFAPFSGQGQIIYDRLKMHKNVFLMFCGHAAVTQMQPRRSDVFDGHTIHTTLQNYQRGSDCPYQCGEAYFRRYKFRPSLNKIEAKTYSPWLDAYRDDLCQDGTHCHQFELTYDMDEGIPFQPVGTVTGAASGSTVCTPWPGHLQGKQYEWYVTVTKGGESTTGPTWDFTSNGSCTGSADCQDGAPCTQDTCSSSKCTRTPIPNCCVTPADCDDGEWCVDDLCDAGSCSHSFSTKACSDDVPCTEADVCAGGVCSGVDMTCNDGDSCTADSCADGECVGAYAPVAGCCDADAQCWDSNHCTADACSAGHDCSNTPIADCCTTTAQCIGDGAPCALENCPAWNEGAFHFDGVDDYITMYRNLGLAQFTIECWFKWDGGGKPMRTSNWKWDNSDINGIYAYPLVTKGFADQEHGPPGDDTVQNHHSVNYFLGISTADGANPQQVLAADFEEHASGSGPPALNHRVYGTTPITLNSWHHAAMTYDGACWQLYLDGKPETDGTHCPHEPPAYETEHHFGLGTAMDRNGGRKSFLKQGIVESYFSGLMDEVRVWDHARTAGEIAANMGRALTSGSGLVARWGLDSLEPGSEFLTPDALGVYDGVVVDGSFTTADFVDLSGGVCEKIPTELQGLLVERQGPKTTVSWTSLGSWKSYDLASGLISELRVDGGVDQAECLADNQVLTSFDDVRPNPPSEDAYYYIVRASSGCGVGTYGKASDLTPRLPTAACP